jgi:hypothetical protein
MRLYESKKLHYGEYLYKLAIVNSLASYFRTEFQPKGDLKWCKKRLDEVQSFFRPNTQYIEKPWGNGGRFKDTIPVEHLKKHTEYKIRCEMNTLHIYSNDRKMIVDLGNKLRQRYIELWEPDPNNVTLLQTNTNIILVNKTPEYEYKITLGKKPGQPSLAKWINNNPKLAKMGDIAKDQCLKGGYIKGYYFHVRDNKALSLAQLLIGDNIQRIDKFVYVPT